MARLKLKHGSKATRIGRSFGRGKKQIKEKIPVAGIFLPNHEQQLRMIAMRGSSDDEIAEMCGVDPKIFQRWRKAYPSFDKALQEGRLKADADVVVSLFKQTQGYTYEEQSMTKDGDVVEVKKYMPASTDASKYWLNNRQPENWKSTSTTRVAGGGKGEEPVHLKVETRNELIESILGLVQSKPDGKGAPDSAQAKR